MEERVTEIVQDVGRDLAENLEQLERRALTYAKAYTEWVVLKDSPCPPHQPPGMHAMGAKMVREMVLDRAALP